MKMQSEGRESLKKIKHQHLTEADGDEFHP